MEYFDKAFLFILILNSHYFIFYFLCSFCLCRSTHSIGSAVVFTNIRLLDCSLTLHLKLNSYTVPGETTELNFNWKLKDQNLLSRKVLYLALENEGG